MKKIDTKLKKAVALLLVGCIAIGLVSSTAIKLVSSSYYLKHKRQLVTNIKPIDNIINVISGNDNSSNNNSNSADNGSFNGSAVVDTPVETAPETSAVEVTNAPQTSDTTAAPTVAQTEATTKKPDSTEAQKPTQSESKPSETQEPSTDEVTTTEAPTTTEPSTDSPATIKQKQEILNTYKDIVNYAKKTGKPSFQKVTYRTLEKDTMSTALLHSVESAYPQYFVSKENAQAAPVVVPANTKTTELCINNDYYACMLATADASAAIKTATSVKLEDGSRKITIVLRDEEDPKATEPNAKKAASYTSAMFPVMTAEKVKESVQSTLLLEKVSSAKLTYTDCTVELVYNPSLKRIISLKQTVNYKGELKGTVLSATGTVTEISEYSSFNYGIV